MSQLTGARSMQGASDEVHECEPCTFQGIQKYAQYLCQDCIEYMCNACRGDHNKFKKFRGHSISDLICKTYSCEPCQADGQSLIAEFYCEECKEFLCSSCEKNHKRSKKSTHHKVERL